MPITGAPPVTVIPVDIQTWPLFEKLFSGRGCPHFCWCTAYRVAGTRNLDSDMKQRAMHTLVTSGTPVGVLAVRLGEAVGWCSVAPRESYVSLNRSRTMPRVTNAPTWTILCLFIPRSERGQGLTGLLLQGAVEYARRCGAAVVEAYPFDTAGITATHRGHSRVFVNAGFRQDGSRWALELRTDP